MSSEIKSFFENIPQSNGKSRFWISHSRLQPLVKLLCPSKHEVSLCTYYWMISHLQVHSIYAAVGRLCSWGPLAYQMHRWLLWDHHLHVKMICGFVRFRAQQMILTLFRFTEGRFKYPLHPIPLGLPYWHFYQRLYCCIYNRFWFFFDEFKPHSFLYAQFDNM